MVVGDSIMESKNIKPRILDALDVIGRPATAREIATVGAIDERIHPRLKEMEAAGDLIRFQEIGQPILYALPTMEHGELDDETTTPTTAAEHEGMPMITTKQAPQAATTRFSPVYEALQSQQQQLSAAISDYVSFVLANDRAYQAMIDAECRIQSAINEMDSRGLV